MRHQIVSIQQNTQGLDGFYVTLQKLLDRFFGETTTGMDSVENGLSWSRSNDTAGWIVDRKYSGEMLELFKPPVLSSGGSASSNARSDMGLGSLDSTNASNLTSSSSSFASSSINTVTTNGVKTNLTLLKVFTENNDRGISWQMKATNFPKKVQFYFRDFLTRKFPDDQMESFYSSFFSDNHHALYQRLLTYTLAEQKFTFNKLRVDPLDYFFICLVRYACVNTSKENNPCEQLKRVGFYGWVSNSVYLDLLQTWIARLFSDSKESSRSNEQKDDAFAIGRMFLRLVADFWLGNNLVVKRNFENIAYYNKHKTGANQGMQLNEGNRPLSGDPLVVETMDDSTSVEITDLTMQSIYLLLNHLLVKPMLWSEYDQIREGQTVKDPEYDNMKQENKSYRHMHHRLSSDHHRPEHITSSEDYEEGNDISSQAYPPARVCPVALGILQVPLFDTLRIVFDRVKALNNIHTYFMAIKVWLLYIQPWTAYEPAQAIRQRLKEKWSNRSAYDQKWESYVSANFHFYTTMFAIFLKSVSNLDLSFLDENDMDVFYHLFRAVIGVFKVDAPLRKFIDKLTAEYRAFVRTDFHRLIRTENAVYIDIGDNRRKHFPDPWGNVSLQRHLFSVFRQHRLIYPDLGLVEPRAYELAGATDFRKLVLEEDSIIGAMDAVSGALVTRGQLIDAFSRAIVTQNKTLIFDKFSALIGLNSLLGFQPFESELAHQLRVCILEYGTKLLGRNEEEWQKLVKLHSKGHMIHTDKNIEFGHHEPERVIVTGKLTNKGKGQLLEGMRLSKTSIRTFVDPLDLPIMSYEWPWLVTWFSRLSKYANEKLSLPRDGGAVYKQWRQVLELRLPTSHTDTIDLVRRNIDRFRNAFRINLRALAGIRMGSYLMAVVALGLYWSGLLPFGLYMLTLILAVLGYAFFDGTNTWLPIPNEAL